MLRALIWLLAWRLDASHAIFGELHSDILSVLTCVHGLLNAVGSGHGSAQQLEAETESTRGTAAASVLEAPGHLLELVRHDDDSRDVNAEEAENLKF